MNVLPFGFKTLVNLALLLFSLLDEQFNLIFDDFGIVQEVLVLLFSDLILNSNKVRFFYGNSGVQKFNPFSFKIFFSSKEYFLLLLKLSFPIIFFLFLFFKGSLLLLSDVS